MNKRKVLIISTNKDTFTIIKNVLPVSKYTPFYVETILEAKKQLHKETYDIVVIQAGLKDEFGVKSAVDFVRIFNVQVLLMVKNDIFDQTCYKVNESGIYVLSLPTNKNMIYQSIVLIEQSILIKQKYEREIIRLKKQIQDDRKVNQAKLMLIEQYNWTEDKAHHYIEKLAMDTSQTKVEIAMSLLNRLDE